MHNTPATQIIYFTSKFFDLLEKQQAFKVLVWNRQKLSKKIYTYLSRESKIKNNKIIKRFYP